LIKRKKKGERKRGFMTELRNRVSALEKCCSGMADRCDDLMGKYESMLRRTTQVEVSVGLMRSRFETCHERR